jgi:hypothetical protein
MSDAERDSHFPKAYELYFGLKGTLERDVRRNELPWKERGKNPAYIAVLVNGTPTYLWHFIDLSEKWESGTLRISIDESNINVKADVGQ